MGEFAGMGPERVKEILEQRSRAGEIEKAVKDATFEQGREIAELKERLASLEAKLAEKKTEEDPAGTGQ